MTTIYGPLILEAPASFHAGSRSIDFVKQDVTYELSKRWQCFHQRKYVGQSFFFRFDFLTTAQSLEGVAALTRAMAH